MDSGYLQPGETMEDDYDFSQALLPEEIIGIIDQLLCHEVWCLDCHIIRLRLTTQMAWHMGHPLSQTIFTSLHIDRLLSPSPLTLNQTHFDKSEGYSQHEPLTLQILRAYCLGLIKTCWFVNNRVKSEHFYEVPSPSVIIELVLTTIRRKTSLPIHIIEVYSKILTIHS